MFGCLFESCWPLLQLHPYDCRGIEIRPACAEIEASVAVGTHLAAGMYAEVGVDFVESSVPERMGGFRTLLVRVRVWTAVVVQELAEPDCQKEESPQVSEMKSLVGHVTVVLYNGTN